MKKEYEKLKKYFKMERLLKSIAVIKKKELYKSEWQREKQSIGRTLNDAWDKYTESLLKNKELFSKEKEWLTGWADVYYSALGLNNISSIRKRLGVVSDSQEKEEGLLFLKYAEHLRGLIASTKDSAKNGKRPSPTQVGMNETDKFTCPCCFRKVAVGNGGRMVHHGYERPETGTQTASCPGVQFPPLEKNLEGLLWQIEKTAQNKNECEGVDFTLMNEITILHKNKKKIKTIKKGDPDWAEALENEKRRILANKAMLEVEILFLEEQLVKWEEFHENKKQTSTPSM